MRASGSVWISCTDCGHTDRALVVMASRVLRERTCCPACSSAEAPVLHATPAGASIARPEWERIPLTRREGELFTSFVAHPQEAAPAWGRKALLRLRNKFLFDTRTASVR